MYGTYEMMHRNPSPIPLCHLHKLLLLLLLPVLPQNSLVYLFWLASHPSQLLAPHNRKSGAPGFCTSHSVYAQSALNSHRRSTYPYLRSSCQRRHRLMFRSYLLLRTPAVLSAVTLPPAVEEATLESVAGSPVFLSAIRRGGAL